jgi:fumarate reductase iron-sulfur subunit
MRTRRLQIQRFRPEQDATPVWEQYEVPCANETSVLDALIWVKEHRDSSLAFRWSCRMGICGSCGFSVDGEPTLGCHAFVRDYADGLRIAPLPYFPVQKDLMVDMTKFLEHLSAVMPYMIRSEPSGAHPLEQTPAQLARYKQFAGCINCGLCYAACPQFGLNEEFLGPAAIALAHRYNLDSRDQGTRARLTVLNQARGVWSCTFVGSCSRVCPKRVEPAAAVNQSKLSAVIGGLRGWLRPTVTDGPEPEGARR